MGEIWVVNASPLIALGKVGQLDLLRLLSEDVLLPEPVVQEILAGPEGDPARSAIAAGWGHRVPADTISPQVLEWSLGTGESAVLSVALEDRGRRAVLDDAEGRRCARTQGIPVIGTLGVVLRARKAGLIPAAVDVIRVLRFSGLFLDEGVVQEALRDVVGEEWLP
jgi:predicted nucleic acid-binding protein